jgi:hypothetical protein
VAPGERARSGGLAGEDLRVDYLGGLAVPGGEPVIGQAQVDPGGLDRGVPGLGLHLCVPKTSSTSCDQAIFVDQATGASLFSDAVLAGVDWRG